MQETLDGIGKLLDLIFYSITHVLLGLMVFSCKDTPIHDEHVACIMYWVLFVVIFGVFLLTAGHLVVNLNETIKICVMKFGRNRQQRSKIRLFFGYGLMIFVGCLANCLALLMEYSIRKLALTFITFSLHGLLSYSLTHAESGTEEFELVPQQFGLVDGAIFMIYSFVILASVETCHEESEKFKTLLKIWFSMLVLWGVHGIWQTWNGIVVRKDATLPLDRPECKICLLEYTETSRTPRILKECFHTACEACLDRLLAQSNYKYVQCPFCQTVTGVTGAARKLPKNHAVLDTIQAL